MTIPNLAVDDTLAESWFDAVADQLNDLPQMIQSGSGAVTLDAGGLGTITFPTAFAAAPVVLLTVQLSTGAQRTAQIESITASAVVVRCYNAGTLEVSTTRNVHWIALGAPA